MTRGRKSQWNRPTKMIRVPIEFETELLEMAHRLDKNQTSNSDSELNDAIESFLMTLRAKQRLIAEPWFRKFQKALKP